MIVLFPVIATVAFGLSFGTAGNVQPTYEIAVVNEDLSGLGWSQYLIGNLSETVIMNVQYYSDSDAARSDLSQGRIQAVLIIPEDFGLSCNSFWDSPMDPSGWTNTTVTLFGQWVAVRDSSYSNNRAADSLKVGLWNSANSGFWTG